MRTKMLPLIGALMSFAIPAHAADLITLASKHDYRDTQARLEAALHKHKMRLFAKVDHTAGAAKVGLKMQPETLFIFGNPMGGTPFMVAEPTAAIDLPMKALVWQNKAGKVFVTYNTADFLVDRHHIHGLEKNVKNVDGVLKAIAVSATE